MRRSGTRRCHPSRGGRAGAQGLAALSCGENVNHPIWIYITAVQPRRYLVVGEDRGAVSGMFLLTRSSWHSEDRRKRQRAGSEHDRYR